MDDKDFSLEINDKGNAFYKKWKKDTLFCLFVAAPISLIFLTTCFIMIVGISIKLILIMILPIILIIRLFVYSSLIVRKKYMNYLVKSISMNDNVMHIETFNWFNNNSIIKSSPVNNIEISESTTKPYFRNKDLYILNCKNSKLENFYIPKDFFEKIDNIIRQLN